MSKILKALDGWKLVLAVLGIFGCGVWDAYHNGHSGQFLGAVLATIGWLPSGEWTGEAMTKAVLGAGAVWGLASKLYKAEMQRRAGSSVSGLLQTEGYVKAAVADGVVTVGVVAGEPRIAVAPAGKDQQVLLPVAEPKA